METRLLFNVSFSFSSFFELVSIVVDFLSIAIAESFKSSSWAYKGKTLDHELTSIEELT